MAILRLRDENGEVHSVRALRGEAGAGVHVGRYVGDSGEDSSWRYIDLGSPHVRAVWLADSDVGYLPSTLVTADSTTTYNGIEVAKLVAADNGMMQLAVSSQANWEGAVYNYIAFVEEATE